MPIALSCSKGASLVVGLFSLLIPSMAFTSSKVPNGSIVTKTIGNTNYRGKIYPLTRGFDRWRPRNTGLLMAKLRFPNKHLGSIYEKTGGFSVTRGSSLICLSSRTQKSETDCSDASR